MKKIKILFLVPLQFSLVLTILYGSIWLFTFLVKQFGLLNIRNLDSMHFFIPFTGFLLFGVATFFHRMKKNKLKLEDYSFKFKITGIKDQDSSTIKDKLIKANFKQLSEFRYERPHSSKLGALKDIAEITNFDGKSALIIEIGHPFLLFLDFNLAAHSLAEFLISDIEKDSLQIHSS